jgi:uncharacterized protein (TIGR02145 family)
MVSGNQEQTDDNTIEKFCYGNNDENCKLYGRMYEWAEMVQYLNGGTNATEWDPIPTGNVQGICPSGWHIPSNDEWQTLITSLGGTLAGGNIKEPGSVHWANPNSGANNSSGFTAIAGGQRWSSGSFANLNYYVSYWTTTGGEDPATEIYFGGASYATGVPSNGQNFKTNGNFVRCLQD